MILEPSLQQLAAIQADKEIDLPKPLSEGQLATVLEAQRLAILMERRIENAEAHLYAAKCPVPSSFKHVMRYLDQANAELGRVVVSHLDAEERGRA